MNKKNQKFVDELRSIWFSGKAENTPVDILANIPLHIKKLISIIDELDNNLIDQKLGDLNGKRK